MADRERKPNVGDEKEFMRLFGSAPWWKPIDKRRYRSKIFQSGNSLAVRIPAGTKLQAGMEMDVVIENGESIAMDPVERPKRKFNIAKVAGSATNLQFIKDEDRLFEERSLDWEIGRKPVGA